MKELDQIINKENTITLLKDLVSIHSPYYNEFSILNYVYDWLKSKGLPAEYHYYEEGKITKFKGANIIGKISQNKEGPVVLLNGHVDTVQVCEGWTRNPLEPKLENNRLYGLGSLDMKSGVCAIMLALEAFKQTKQNFKGSILYTFVSDEEGPYGLGTHYLIEDNFTKDVDVAVVPEPSAGFTGREFPCVCLGARGGYQYDIHFRGNSTHAATPELGLNAILEASKLITELNHTDLISDEKLGKGSICVIGITGGGQACSVADTATVNVFRHTVNSEDKNTIIKEIKEAAKRANIQCDYEIKFREAPSEESDGFMPYTVDEEEPYAKIFLNTVEKTIGKKPNIAYFSSIGDYNYLGSRLKVPTLVFGPRGQNFHSADEWVNVDDVVDTAKVIYNYLLELLD
ncbi:MAG: ArgE/DapE family deacylase [Clostridia bacterium]|nr:ArgE/DapE family deacylase [Clostridia bacterium]